MSENSMQSRQLEHPVYIDSNQQLALFCEQWSRSTMLALDTEFIRTDTFFPIGALIQLSDGTECFLIDPLVIDDFSPLKALLVNPDIVKVLHSCSEDLEVFDRLFGVLPEPLIDTQIAATLDGLGFSVGYQRLTEALLQVHVPKGETRSNWLQRPLTDSQIHYAALDVFYLPEMYQRLRDSLEAKGRLGWLQEECVALLSKYRDQDHGERYYTKLKSAWKLNVTQLAVLQTITRWREQQARQRDRPRGRVLKDLSCYEIARLRPRDIKTLAAIDEIGAKTVRKYGAEILKLIKQAQEIGEADLPASLPKPLPPASNDLLKRLKAHIRLRSEQLNIAPEFLVRKRDFEELLRSGHSEGEYQLPESLSGWRQQLIGKSLLDTARREGKL